MSKVPKNDLNREFLQFYLSSSLPLMKVGLIITLALFILFAVFNRVMYPGLPETKFYLRFGLIGPFIVTAVVAIYIPALKRFLSTIFIVLNLTTCGVIFYVGQSATLSQPGYQHYSSWVMLVIIGFFTFHRLRFRTLTVIGALMVLSYTLATIINGTLAGNSYAFHSNLFFVIAVYSLGFFMAFTIEKLNWKNFIHKRTLSENYKKLLAETRERKDAVEALRSSEHQYHQTLDSIPDWIYVLDKEMKFVMLNSFLEEEHLRQGFPINCIGKKINKVYPYIPATTLDEINHVFKTGEILIGEQQLFLRDRTIYGETRKVPIFRDNEVIQVMIIMRNRSKEKEIEELKQKNIDQKETLLREIHHRVKNNLAIVVSLLNLQLRNNSDPELRRIIRDIEMRIRSMALIHEHLYRSDNLDRIPLDSYLRSLASIIMGTFSGHKVNLITDLDPAEVSIETALPLGLITNELLTNAFKYAFPIQHQGEITIRLRKGEGDSLTLTVTDNGIGLPENFNMETQTSLGMFIIRLLVEQLDAKIVHRNDHGTSFTMQFRNLIPNTNFSQHTPQS